MEFTTVSPQSGEDLVALLRRAAGLTGPVAVVLPSLDLAHMEALEPALAVLDEVAALPWPFVVKTEQPSVADQLRSRGFAVEGTTQGWKSQAVTEHTASAVTEHEPEQGTIQTSFHLPLGLRIPGPKIRATLLLAGSVGLFLFVLFRLLPSSTINVWPRKDSVTQMINVFLVQSGATVDLSPRVRSMPLIPIKVELSRTLTFDQISKDFIGTTAHVMMTIVNKTGEEYSLRKGTRITNSAGMVFRLKDFVELGSGAEIAVEAIADDTDLYGEIIGARGNVPAGLRWEFPGLSVEERAKVYAENRVPANGGTTNYRTVLHQEDLEIAKRTLEQDLLTSAKQMADEQKDSENALRPEGLLQILYYDELTKTEYHDFVLPEQFLNEPVTSIPVEGSITYTAYAYDVGNVLQTLRTEITQHVDSRKAILPDTLTLDRLDARVIDYADDFSWMKLTVELTGSERFILDPLTPAGAEFAKKVRELVAGVSKEEALRILKNLPEIDKVDIRLWPPWGSTLPTIPAQIILEEVSA